MNVQTTTREVRFNGYRVVLDSLGGAAVVLDNGQAEPCSKFDDPIRNALNALIEVGKREGILERLPDGKDIIMTDAHYRLLDGNFLQQYGDYRIDELIDHHAFVVVGHQPEDLVLGVVDWEINRAKIIRVASWNYHGFACKIRDHAW